MAKYEINHTCGHTSTVQLFGKCSERERKIEWMERQECPECRRKREAEEAAKITEGLENFPNWKEAKSKLPGLIASEPGLPRKSARMKNTRTAIP